MILIFLYVLRHECLFRFLHFSFYVRDFFIQLVYICLIFWRRWFYFIKALFDSRDTWFEISIVRFYLPYIFFSNRIGGVMVSALASSVVDRGFKPRSNETKDCIIRICCFSAKHAALRRKSKDWLARNQKNVCEWSDMSTRGLLFQWASTMKI